MTTPTPDVSHVVVIRAGIASASFPLGRRLDPLETAPGRRSERPSFAPALPSSSELRAGRPPRPPGPPRR
jgi:hypothetical protein